MVALFQVIRRATDYAITRPVREVIYTVVSREDRYKAKGFIDTFVYRAGDQVGASVRAAADGHELVGRALGRDRDRGGVASQRSLARAPATGTGGGGKNTFLRSFGALNACPSAPSWAQLSWSCPGRLRRFSRSFSLAGLTWGFRLRGRSSMAERQLPKLHTRVRFPSPAPIDQ